MKTLIFFFSILVSLQFVNAGSFENRHNHQLYYTAPATIWEETLPLGNGRLGMMPDGGVDREHIVLNEISLWSGMEADYCNPDASRSLPAIQQLLFEGKNKEAQELMYSSFVPKKPESGGTYGNYQMLADLNIDFSFPHRRKTISDFPESKDKSKKIYLFYSNRNIIMRSNCGYMAHYHDDYSAGMG